jgi:hypothetical protein
MAIPEISPDIRFTFQAKETREAGDPTQAEIGYSFDFFVKPLIRLKRVAAFDLDDAKSRPQQLSAGVRYLPSGLTVERRLSTHRYHPAPDISVEEFYLNRYAKWSTTALYAGWLLPMGNHVAWNPYYVHQNVTSSRPNQQFNQFCLVLDLYF